MNTEKTAFVFPGQGSQYVGMGKELAQTFPQAAQIFTQADELLGIPLSSLCWDGPQQDLNQTYNTQAAIFVTSLACLAALKSAGYTKQPDFVAGHSMGEYVAYVAAGILSFEDGLKLVRERGRLMEQAGKQNPGKMAAILKLTDEQVAQICQQATEQAGWVQIANYNSPGQIIISGEETGIERAIQLAKAAGARRALVLPVSIAAHSTLMESINAEFQDTVNRVALAAPKTPVIANITAHPLTDVESVRAEMVGQLTASVQWTKSVQWMTAQNVTTFIEIGPKNVLTGLIKRIDKTVTTLNIDTPADINTFTAQN